MEAFRLHLLKENAEAVDGQPQCLPSEQDVIIEAESCCEAIVLANKRWRGTIVTRYEQLPDRKQKIVTKPD